MDLSRARRLFYTMKVSIAAIAILVCNGILASSCFSEKTEKSTAAVSPTGQTVADDATSIKPTAEQEVAKKRGMEQGAAIQAANEAMQNGK